MYVISKYYILLIYIYIYITTYKHIWSGIIVASSGGGEANSGGEIRYVVGGIEVSRDGGFQPERLGDEVRRDPAVAEAPCGLAPGEVAAVGLEVAPKERADVVVVARIHRRVSEHYDGGDSPRRGPWRCRGRGGEVVVVVAAVVVYYEGYNEANKPFWSGVKKCHYF